MVGRSFIDLAVEMNSQKDDCISSRAPNEVKYHPLIMERTFERSLLNISNGVDVERKLAFLYNFYNSLKKILTCMGCDGITHENSLAFCCGHYYCEKCSKNLSFCSKCKIEGRQRSIIIEQDNSTLLAVIEKLRKNFNVERIFFEMLKSVLTAPHEDSAKVTCNTIKNSDEQSQQYNQPSNKFTASRKHFKTLIDKTQNFKKKLLFSPGASVNQPQTSEHDSENLFIHSNEKTVPLDSILNIENSDGCLNPQMPTPDSRNSPIAESLGGDRKRAKRKLSKSYSTGIEAATDKRRSKTRKISIKSEAAGSSDEHCRSPVRSTKKHISHENSSSSTTDALSTNAEGTFIGFIDSEISESYHRFQTAVKCFDFLKSMERENFSDMTTSPSLPNSNHVDVLCHTGQAGTLEKVRVATRSSRSKSLENKAHEKVCKVESAKSIMQQPQESNSSSRTEPDASDDKQESAPVRQDVSKNGGFVLSLPDPEVEEAVDIDSWQRDENVSRKKKARMFKSVKERNRRRIFFDGSVKLPSDHLNVAQLEKPVLLEPSEASSDSQTDNPKQSVPEKMYFEKKDDIAPELSSDCNVFDSKQEAVFSKLMSNQERLSSDCLMETEDEPSLVNNSSVSQACSSKVDVNFSEMGNEEDRIQVSRMIVSDIIQNVIAESRIPSPIKSMTENLSKFDDNSKLKVESSLFGKSSPKTSSMHAEFLPPTEPSVNTNFKSCPVDTVCPKSIASIGSVSAGDRKSHTDHASSSNFSQSPIITNESSSSSIELIKKLSQETVLTISDADININQNHAGEIVTLIPSQPITILSSSSEDNTSTANKTEQTASHVKSNRTVELNDVSSGRLSDDLTEEKSVQPKTSIQDQSERSFDVIRSGPRFTYPEATSVESKDSQHISISNVNFVESPLKKNKFDSPENLPESPKKFILDAINSSDHEKSVLFSSKSGGSSEEILTVPASPRFRSVSCQTTSDLHVSLLKQVFPHLFDKQSCYGFSVYDTPDKSTPADSEARDNLKTPQISATPRPTNFTVVSSVTSSEKKIFENLFTDRSVLDDSSFQCASIAEKTPDISIQPLPSSENKVFSSISPFTGERSYSTARVTFEPDSNVDVEKQKMMKNATCTASSTPNIQTKPFHCASVNTISPMDQTDGSIPNRLATESNEAEFADPSHTNGYGFKAIEKINGEQKSGNQLNNDDMDVHDQNVLVPSTRRISSGAVSNLSDRTWQNGRNATSAINHGSDKGPTPIPDDFDNDVEDNDDDDDDVEFIAGTPTSSRRCVDDNLEKLMTQSFSLKREIREDVSNADSFKNQKPPANSQSSINYSQIRRDSLAVSDLPASEISDIQKPSLELFNSIATSSGLESSPLVLVISGLKDADVRLVKLFCQRFSVSLLDRITSETTHLVVKTDRKSRTARTFKYLQAIVNSICVISIEWVQSCIDNNEILNEEKFIPFDSSGECGPLRAYKSKKGVIPPPLSWLHDYCLFFMEPVPAACTLIQLHEIVEKTGAVVVTDLKDFRKYTTLHHLIIVSDEEDSSQTSNADIANWLQIYQAVAVEFNWLLEVVGRNRVVPFADYELVEIPPNLLLKLNFPDEMLQYEREDVEDSD